MDGIEFTGPAVNVQEQWQFSHGMAGEVEEAVTNFSNTFRCPSGGNTPEYASSSICPETKRGGPEGAPVAWLWLRGLIHVISRYGSDDACIYTMQKTDIRDSKEVKDIPPVCSQILAILGILDEKNVSNRRYNYSNIKDIIGVALNKTKGQQEPNLTGSCALVQWQDICPEHLDLFCGKESWILRSALFRIVTQKNKSKVDEKIQTTYKAQATRYAKWQQEVLLPGRNRPVDPSGYNKRTCDIRDSRYNNANQNYIQRPEPSVPPEVERKVIERAETCAGDGNLPSDTEDSIFAKITDMTEVNIATKEVGNLIKNRSFSYQSYENVEKAFKLVDRLRATKPKEYSRKMDIIIATWPSYRDKMIAQGFQETGTSPDDSEIADAKKRVIDDGTWYCPWL